ncbi:hypothetical protein [Bradyrhizobium sp.]
MVVIKVRETVQPKIAKDHGVQIKSGKIPETEAREHKQEGQQRKERNDGNRYMQARRIKQHVKGCGVYDRMVVVGDVNQGYAADHDVEADQQRQSATLFYLRSALSHLFRVSEWDFVWADWLPQ